MASPLEPVIGNWYRSSEGSTFEVVAINEYDQTIDMQHFEGEIEEIDNDTWGDMTLMAISPPEDWSGPYDDLVSDDFGDVETAKKPENWSGFLNDLDREG